MGGARSESEDFPRLGGALDPINEQFHADYARARDEAELAGPVLVLLGDELTLLRPDDERPRVFPFSPRVFHVLKVVSHVPVTAFTLARGDETARGAVARLREHVAVVQAKLADDVGNPDVHTECRLVLDASATFLDALAAGGQPDSAAFAAAMGPHLRSLLDHATRDQLAALDAAFEEVLALLDEDESAALHVVVAGAHQARERSLGMQYFQLRLGEPHDVDVRVTYAEAVGTVEDAVTLIGTQRLDRVLAAAFFGDERRLQRDLLGDAATRILEHTPRPATRAGHSSG
ncbi:MAG TPA: hypothetical protein VFG69_19540 [Nannocystaceae bacterium]|nr:hypothetical protein [Nannocystaceae bacterium]